MRNVSKTNKWQKKNLPKFSEYFSWLFLVTITTITAATIVAVVAAAAVTTTGTATVKLYKKLQRFIFIFIYMLILERANTKRTKRWQKKNSTITTTATQNQKSFECASEIIHFSIMFWWKQKNEKQKHFELNAALRSFVRLIQTNKKSKFNDENRTQATDINWFWQKRVKMWWTFIISFAFKKNDRKIDIIGAEWNLSTFRKG